MLATLTPELKETLSSLNLTESEYERIVTHLHREPNFNELAMFSVLWSEHCCYKNSRHLLKRLPTTGPRIVQGPGENAGVVEIGDGIQVAFKIESHNHPTAVEPFQGAATGVGGILRDIFTMNARPIASLNSLRFGPLDNPRNKFLLSGAVKGIAHYGNCVGVPTIAGEVFIDDRYSGNPLVNAMAIGVLYDNNIMPSRAIGVGNPILYVGSATGKDGMGGAAFASKELDEKSNEDRPAVQVGDPFAEKLLIEACLEAFATGCVAAAQDMGAAGLTSSSCEMAAKGELGMRMNLDKVPAREPGMKAYEYLLSESQERMLFILEKGKEQLVMDVFAKWHLPAVIIGEVIAEPQIQIEHHGELVVDVPAKLLTDLAPSYDRGMNPPEADAARQRRERQPNQELNDIEWASVPQWLDKLFASHNVVAPTGIFQQYDRHVQNNTLLDSEHQASGVIRLRHQDGQFSGMALAASTDCNPRYVFLDPQTGAAGAVAEAARNVVCVGAEPLAVTDNLNFGNPEKPEIYHQLFYALEGIKEACTVFQTPITGGNVSLYNEHSGLAILPTPVIGMVGLIEDDQAVMTPYFKQAGDRVALVGRFQPTLGGTEYQVQRAGEVYGAPPSVSLEDEFRFFSLIRQLIQQKQLSSVQDVSLGGALTSLLECTFRKHLGFKGDLSPLAQNRRLDEALFGETNGSYLISYPAAMEETIKAACQNVQAEFVFLGEVTSQPELVLPQIQCSLAPYQTMWRETFELGR